MLLFCFGLSLNPLLCGRWTVFKPLVLQNGNARDTTTHDICLEHPLSVLLLCCELSLSPSFCRTATQEAVLNTLTVLLLCCELSFSPMFCRTATQEAVINTLTVLLLCYELSLSPLFCRTATQEAVMNTLTVLLLCCEL